MVNFIKVKKICRWRMILLSGIRSEGFVFIEEGGGIIGRQEYPITTVFQMGSSCFSALLSCSLKFPRAYITQQCIRRVFYFFIIIHPLIFAWYYWLFCISWCIPGVAKREFLLKVALNCQAERQREESKLSTKRIVFDLIPHSLGLNYKKCTAIGGESLIS